MKYTSSSSIPYMSSWTYSINKVFKIVNRLLDNDPVLVSLSNGFNKRFNFIDVGSGKGKVLIQAKRKLKRINRIYGLEKDLELLYTAKNNLAITNTETILIHGDASERVLTDLIDSPIIVFLYNPFKVDILEKFIKNNPEIVMIIYMNPQYNSTTN